MNHVRGHGLITCGFWIRLGRRRYNQVAISGHVVICERKFAFIVSIMPVKTLSILTLGIGKAFGVEGRIPGLRRHPSL
jgi:hypothetical protein